PFWFLSSAPHQLRDSAQDLPDCSGIKVIHYAGSIDGSSMIQLGHLLAGREHSFSSHPWHSASVPTNKSIRFPHSL
ncbi:MAG: hypothetical protein ABFD07_18000, partial [Methanobacterium sp.]